jgi:hypothetical protein
MNQRRFYFTFFTIALFAILYNVYFAYSQIQNTRKIRSFVLNHEAQSVEALLKAFRQTYQEIFEKYDIPLDNRTIHLLPVTATPAIAHRFGKLIQNDVIIRTVSDHPRAFLNAPTPFE